jgi:hypothetical protein
VIRPSQVSERRLIQIDLGLLVAAAAMWSVALTASPPAPQPPPPSPTPSVVASEVKRTRAPIPEVVPQVEAPQEAPQAQEEPSEPEPTGPPPVSDQSDPT